MSEADTTSEPLKLGPTGGRSATSAPGCGSGAADAELARPAAAPAVEAEGGEVVTTARRRAALLEERPTLQCRRHRRGRTELGRRRRRGDLSATTGREASHLRGRPMSTPRRRTARGPASIHHPCSRGIATPAAQNFAIAAGDILFRLAHAAGVDYAAFALMHYGTGNVRYDDLVRRLVKAVDQDNAPEALRALRRLLSYTGPTRPYRLDHCSRTS